MGNTIFIKDRRVCVKPLKSRLEAIQKLMQMWHKYLSLATFAYNIFNSPNLCNHSPYELIFGRRPKILLDLEANPDIKVSGT